MADTIFDANLQAAQEGADRTLTFVADLSLDKAMLQDVLAEKV
jgi:hypothetical protein